MAGTQLPFLRLMRSLDAIAARHRLDVVAQTADPGFVAQAMRTRPFLAPSDFDAHVAAAELVVAHAGMGVIIAAAEHGKPLVLMPRRAELGEHRNDHQQATARRFAGACGLRLAEDEASLEAAVLAADRVGFGLVASHRRHSLIEAVRRALR
ncbi:MAG: glycosyltransferase [Novosphingobium sp.]